MKKSDTTSRLLSAVVAAKSARASAGARNAVPRTGGAPQVARFRTKLVAGDSSEVAPSQTTLVVEDSPEVARLRTTLMTGDRASAVAAATEFLELVEPGSLAEAQARAFHEPPPSAAKTALRDAWDAYRHDRYRGLN